MSDSTNEIRWGIPDGEMRSSLQSIHPMTARVPWGVDAVGAAELNPVPGIPKIRVAVLDTGVDAEHPDLAPVVVRRQDFTASRSGPGDVNGHGTHVAGIIAASRLDGNGIMGVCPDVEIWSYKVLDDSGSGTDTQILSGYRKAIADGCHVFNFSLGGPSPMPALQEMIGAMRKEGRFSICASGNGGPTQRDAIYPARSLNAICVGSFDRAGGLSSFSQQSGNMFCFAPGGAIESCYPGGRYTVMSGTSMATPHVTGVVARAMAGFYFLQNRYPTDTELTDILTRWMVKDTRYPGERFAGKGRPYINDKTVSPDTPQPDRPAIGVRIEIPLAGVNELLDESLRAGGIIGASISFLVNR